MKRNGLLDGWRIVRAVSLLGVVLVGGAFAVVGPGEAAYHLLLRATALLSVVLFTMAFTASALHRAYKSGATSWIRRNRRYLGVSFAVSHFIHLAAIIALVRSAEGFAEGLDTATVIGGGLAYLFLAAMTATSFDRSAAWLGARRWKLLHTTGMYYLWFIFFITYMPRFGQAPGYVLIVTVLVAALGARLFVRFGPRAGLTFGRKGASAAAGATGKRE